MNAIAQTAVLAPDKIADKINVLVVDDSLVIRGTIARLLSMAPEIAVAGTVQNGKAAVDRVAKGGIDVVVLDIEMPVMDGISALPLLLAADRDLVVIMASTLTTRNAEISLQALNLGAADYVPKPSSASEIYSTEDFRRDLLEKVIALGAKRLRRRLGRQPKSLGPAPARTSPTLAPVGRVRPRVLAIGSSTGGPNALAKLFSSLKPLGIPVVITQHMPAAFTAILAKHLAKETGWNVSEAVDGEFLSPDRVLVAPGDQHLLLKSSGSGVQVKLDQSAKENYCRPAVDPMLRSLVAAYGAGVLAVVLTGMGQDGMLGATGVIAAGGSVIAQDEATSVVWGMPGAVTRAGAACAVLPLSVIAPQITQIVRGTAL